MKSSAAAGSTSGLNCLSPSMSDLRWDIVTSYAWIMLSPFSPAGA
jgi:hypothetical protein